MARIVEVSVINTIIEADEALSPVLDLEDFSSMAIQLPAEWTAADLTFQACATREGTYVDVTDEMGKDVTLSTAPLLGNIATLTVTASKLSPLRFIKLRSGNSATPVNQEANRAITLILKR